MNDTTTIISPRHATARRQRSLLGEAMSLGERCGHALDAGDLDRLDLLLEERALLLVRIAEQADVLAVSAGGVDAPELQADLDAIDDLRATIARHDERLVARLRERRDRCARELGGLHAAGRAAAAYGLTPAARTMDGPRAEDRRA
ncbi:MAG: hypothetical protein WCK33_07210 [Phycisphaerae bacterium]|jgi:hypothetical protein